MASILMRYNRMQKNCLDDLCFVIEHADAYDFTRLRDDKVDLRTLRNKLIGIPDNYVVSMEDINTRVEQATAKLHIVKLHGEN